ncbi:cupin domain-containing protein [Roseibaca sp. Y0-43]|uniref:cupin domain-containing protein n=1 Tax=Roseibaca sp. Y0-43 TaxID=2816854 RepID=UPI001D0C85AC|nr:cupin domain-containing protein [Roseibaca sp. Y0-43]MCC1481858.1 cupin domain-containing protein [Roseibaca sp. Y0-43]
MTTATDLIARFGLTPHPEGGWYRQTWIAEAAPGARPAGTAILFLLQAGESSHWHKVDAAEIWHFHAGAPLALDMAATDAGPATRTVLGNAAEGHAPQAIVPPDHWQAARSLGDWSLVGCTVSPAFRFDGFTLAPKGFDIPRSM